MLMKRLLIALILFIASGTVSAQGTDQQLAVHYYQNGEFDKALMYFEKLYSSNPTGFYYQYLFKCHLELKQYKEAEKLIKKHQKREPRNLVLFLDLATVYDNLNDKKKAEQEYNKAIKELGPDYNQVNQLGDAFKSRNLYDFALATYEKADDLFGSKQFEINKTEIYALKGDHTKMMQSYFDLIDQNPDYANMVQNALSQLVAFDNPNDPKVDLLKGELLKRIQKDPENEVYTDMLVWFFQQKGDFNSAFNQVKALDKRLKLDGQKVNEFASLCINNEQYEAAVKAYDYIVALGISKPYYFTAQSGLIDVLYQKIVYKGFYTPEELTLFETNSTKLIQEFGDGIETVRLKLQLAHVYAFFLRRNQDAIALLEKVLELPGLTDGQKAEVKMELGDELVLAGQIWDASLYYSQVEKAFKHDVVGHEAKFRNARVFYYSHDYKWAQSQLDVLKTSTSKLIANDALDLSLMITENIGLDSIPEPLNLYSDAELLFYQNKNDEALKKLDTLNKDYTWHSLADEAIFLRYRIAKRNGDFESAEKYLQEVLTKFPQDILGDNAVFELAEMYQYHYKNNDKAAEFYKKILFDYPGSLFVVEARKRYRILRGENLN